MHTAVLNFVRFCACLLLLAGSLPAMAVEVAKEPALRAALVFNFLKFTEWPVVRASDEPLTLCVISNDGEMIAALEALSDKKIRGRPIVTARIYPNAQCEVVYVDSRTRWRSSAESLAARNVLLIGSYAGFIDEGGMIELDIRETGSRFDINLRNVRRAGLRLYPQLLQLARRVVE